MTGGDRADRWRRIGDLFERALGRPAAERSSFLAAACPDDPGLAAEVERMLTAHGREGGILDRSPVDRDAILPAALGGTGREGESPPPTASGEPAPDRAGPYRVVREIGRGGMGVVYEAWDDRLRRPLALKLLPAALRADAEARARFLDEARAASALEHPAICTVYDLGETDDGRQFIAMAYYRGRTVEDRLRDGPVPVDRAVDWTLQAAGGLAEAHAAGIVHRDVKPSNLLVTDDGRVKILDFGVAKLEGAGVATVPGTRLGTPAYMAPEQARGDRVDGRADLFSLGAVLFEMVTGRRVASDEPDGDHARSDASPPVADLRRLRPEAPEGLAAVVARCMAEDPGDRYASAADLGRDLEALRAGGDAARPGGTTAARLPASLTRLVGREQEVRRALDELRGTRLLTLTGPGGTGKTRMAVEVARRAAEGEDPEGGSAAGVDGVYFVSLAAVRDPSAVAPALCAALGVAETPVHTPVEALQRTFADRRCLLVVDNFEQAVEGAPVLTDLLARCPGLDLLVTSRILLRVTGERVFPVPPLGLPPEPAAATVEDLERAPATALFLDRARAARADLHVTDAEAPAVAGICARLDGLPLAIELAAARVRHFSPHSLLSRLGRRLDILGGGPRDTPERHQTLRRAVLWSYDLLEPAERALFRRLGTFADGFTLESVETLLEEEREEAPADGLPPVEPGHLLDGLTTLLDHSLIHRVEPREAAGADRWAMFETLRELAFEKLEEAGERGRVVRAHGRAFLRLAEAAAPELTGPDQARWIDRLASEQGNLRVALDRCEEAERTEAADRGHRDGRLETALRLAAALWRFWLVRGDLRGGRDRLERLVERAGAAPPAGCRRPLVGVLQGLGTLLSNLGDNERAADVLERGLALCRELGDRAGVARQLDNLGWVAAEVSDLERARELSEEALAISREMDDPRAQAVALNNLGWAALYGGDLAAARAALAESLALRRRSGDRRGEAFALTNLAWAEEQTGRLDEADALLDEAERLFEGLDDRLVPGWTQAIRAMVARSRGDHSAVVAILRDAMPFWIEPGNISGQSICCALLARSLGAAGDPAALREAAEQAEQAEVLGRRVGSPWLVARALLARAEADLAAGAAEAAARRGRRALATFERFGGRPGMAESLDLLASLARHRDDPDGAEALAERARRLRQEMGMV